MVLDFRVWKNDDEHFFKLANGTGGRLFRSSIVLRHQATEISSAARPTVRPYHWKCSRSVKDQWERNWDHLNRLYLRFSIFVTITKPINFFIVYTSRDPHRKVFKMVDKYGPVINVSFGIYWSLFFNRVGWLCIFLVNRYINFLYTKC